MESANAETGVRELGTSLWSEFPRLLSTSDLHLEQPTMSAADDKQAGPSNAPKDAPAVSSAELEKILNREAAAFQRDMEVRHILVDRTRAAIVS